MDVELTERQIQAFRVLITDPNCKNTKLWIRMNINSPDTDSETRYHLAQLLKKSDSLIPIGNVRAGRFVRELAKEGHLTIDVLPDEERQKVINEMEEKFRADYSKKREQEITS